MRRILGLVAAVLFLLPAAAMADGLPAPTGDVILTITGEVSKTNAKSDSGDAADLDRAMLEALPQQVIVTQTPWHEGEITFEGPLLSDIMELVGGSGEYAGVTALDDYSVDVPVSDFAEHGPILALKTNGNYMPEDDKGPLFVIYDYDGKPGLNTEEYHSRSVWSVRTIELQAD